MALPLYQGIMIQPFMPSARGWLSGTGLRAKWDYNSPEALVWNPQFLMQRETAQDVLQARTDRIGFRDIARSTDVRSFISAVLPPFPCGNKVPVLRFCKAESTNQPSHAGALLNSFVFDWLLRRRLASATINWHVLRETVLVQPTAHRALEALSGLTGEMNLLAPAFAPLRLQQRTGAALPVNALTPAERLRHRVMIDATSASLFNCNAEDLRHVLHDTDLPAASIRTLSSHESRLDARGFWRVDRDKPPELRHTVLTQIAFADLQRHIEAAAGDLEADIQTLMDQNHGEGWLLPETLRLADYDLGHDDRAKEHQPVATELGPRFYDWQLSQPAEEAGRETHLHARNLLGEHAYRRLLAELDQRRTKQPSATGVEPLSEVAEERHHYDNWLDRPEANGSKLGKPAATDQTDLFD